MTHDPIGDLLPALRFDAAGLIPAIIQQWDSGAVLMLGYMNEEALRRTIAEGRVTFWSRSRQELWRKGDTSGNVQYLRSIAADCDGDALLVTVDQIGPACHTGTPTCFDERTFFSVEGSSGGPEMTSDGTGTTLGRGNGDDGG